MRKRYKASYYNLLVAHGPYTLLFNGVSAGLLRLPADVAGALRPFLGPERDRTAGTGRSGWQSPAFERRELPESIRPIFNQLLRGQFFLPEGQNEFERVRTRYSTVRRNDPFLVTLTTTLDCNLGCYYCYEDKAPISMSRETCDAILAWIRDRIETAGHDRLYTDWYGGEPMLNREIIDYFTERALEYCEPRKIGYSSAMISNGTLWPEAAREFVERNRIRHVQFTFDGVREDHDRRRRYVRGDEARRSSFDRIVETIDRLIGFVRIYLRVNVDPGSADRALELVDFFVDRAWLREGTRFYPYLAMIGPMTEHCSFLGRSERMRGFSARFDALQNAFQAAISRHIDPRGIQHLQYYPMTVEMNCAAVGENSVVFGPDGLMYKCGLDVGQRHLAHGRISPRSAPPAARSSNFKIISVETTAASPHRWDTYDPFTHERCGECQYLPICMGGCPKAQFERNTFYLDAQSKYWEENIDTLLRTYHDTTAARLPVD
jgi:uncharacterized protein